MKAKKRYLKKIIIAAAIAIVFYLGFFGEHNFYNLYKLRKDASNLREEIEKREREREALLSEIEKLKNDAAYIEQVAREEFKMGKKGERIFIIKDEDRQ